MGTDKYAYASKLKNVNPLAKLFVTAVSTGVLLACGSIAASVATVLLMCAVTARMGGTQPHVFIRLLNAPFLFLIIGCLTVLVGVFPADAQILFGFLVGNSVYGITEATLVEGLRILSKAMGIIASVYFFVLSTPMTDLSWALGKLRLPPLFIELMELIYRFIFILMDTMHRIRTAQASRLGYHDLKASYQSTGVLASMVFLRAYRRSDRIYSALESRGYTGRLTTLGRDYESGKEMYFLCLAVVSIQILAIAVEKVVWIWPT